MTRRAASAIRRGIRGVTLVGLRPPGMPPRIPQPTTATGRVSTYQARKSVQTKPAATPQPFGSSWQVLIDQPDRVAALGCFRAATVMALKRGLRNGSITVDHSFSHRAAEDKLIAAPMWQRSRARFIRGLNLPATP